jgi:hypothetical protein
MIEKNVPNKNIVDVVPLPNQIPATDTDITQKDSTKIEEPDKTNYLQKEKSPERKYTDSLREIVKSLVTNNYSTHNYYNDNTQSDTRNINNTVKNITGDDIRRTINNMSSMTNSNLIRNLTETTENKSFLEHNNPSSNIQNKRIFNHITSSIKIPFMNPETSSHREVTNNNSNESQKTSHLKENNESQKTSHLKENNESQKTSSHREVTNNNSNESEKTSHLKEKPVLVEKLERFYNPTQNINLKTPTIAKFPDVIDSKIIKENNQVQRDSRDSKIIKENNQVQRDSRDSKIIKEKPVLVEKLERFYNPTQNIKLKTPTIAKFPDVIDSTATNFSRENKQFTNKVQNILQSSPTVRLFTTKGDVVKSTKEVINHIRTRQNNIIPMLQSGGIVDEPTLAMLGEAGPEMVSPASELNNLLPQSEMSNSITSLANTTLQERAGYQMQQTANQMKKPETASDITIDSSAFTRTPERKQTAPAGGNQAGADAGSSSFDSYLRARMFSIPDWRSRLG